MAGGEYPLLNLIKPSLLPCVCSTVRSTWRTTATVRGIAGILRRMGCRGHGLNMPKWVGLSQKGISQLMELWMGSMTINHEVLVEWCRIFKESHESRDVTNNIFFSSHGFQYVFSMPSCPLGRSANHFADSAHPIRKKNTENKFRSSPNVD